MGRTIPEEVSALRLRWAAAILLALLGTTMLVAPYHFDDGPLAIFRLHLVWWGSGFLAAAVALFAAATLGPPRWLAITSQLGAAGVVLAFAVPLLAGGGAGLTVINYLLLGVTLAAAALVPADDLATLRGRQPRETMDVFVLLCAASALATGCVLILAPTRIAPTIELARFPRLPVMAVVLIGSGLVLGLSQTRVPIPRRILTAIWLLAAAGFLVMGWAVATAAFVRWASLAFYGISGLLLLLQGRSEALLRCIEPSTLQTRLAFVLALAMALPLVAMASFDADRETSTVSGQVLTEQQTLATSLAETIDRYVSLHQAAVAALAAQPGLLALSPAQQHLLLARTAAAYPDINGFGTIGADGQPIARADERQGTSFAGDPMFEQVRRTNQPAIAITISPVIHQAVFSFGAPIDDDNGHFAGAVSSSLFASDVAATLDRADGPGSTQAYLVDDQGRVIAHPDPTLVDGRVDLSSRPPVAAFLQGAGQPGALRFLATDQREVLSGYAAVPDLGWGVVVEQPAADALAGLRQSRDVALAAVLLISVLAAALGIVAAGWLVRPLRALAGAAERLGDGDDTAPLPTSRITEVDELARQFGRMRVRLAQRSQELAQTTSERVLAEGQVRLRDEFIAAAAHELKTPLTSLIGHTQLLQKRAATAGTSSASEAMQRSLRSIDRQSRKLARLVEQLLDIGRIDTHRFRLDRQPTDVTTLVWSTVADVSSRTRRHVFVVDVPATQPAVVDPVRFERVLTSLLDNAVKFSPHGGSIEVCVRRRNGTLEVSVRDYGVGIPAEHRARIFERSYQVHAGHSAGLGLGLHISRYIVEQHGGTLTVESPPDGGSRFTVEVPLQAAEAEAEAELPRGRAA